MMAWQINGPEQAHRLVAGQSYRVRMRMHKGNYRWYEYEMVAVFLGWSGADDLTRPPATLMWSGRPVFGSTEFAARDLLSASVAMVSAPSMPRRVLGGSFGAS